jgi:hypothetical protein
MPARVTPLPRGNGLQRTADVISLRGGGQVLPFPKRPKDTTAVNAWRLVNAILEDKRDRTAPKRAPRKRSGNSRPTAEVRRLVLARDTYACVCCGRSILGQRYSLGHRLRASQGGRAVASNLLTFLGLGGEGHHGRIDRRADPADEAKGYTIRSGSDPAHMPVTVVREYGTRQVWLDDAGSYLDYPPDGDDNGGSAA